MQGVRHQLTRAPPSLAQCGHMSEIVCSFHEMKKEPPSYVSFQWNTQRLLIQVEPRPNLRLAVGIMHHHCVPLRRRPPNIINFSLHSHIMTKGPMCINTVFISPLPCNEHRNSNRVVFTLPTIALYPYVYIVAFFFSVGLVFHVSYACMHMYICIHTYIYM